MNTYSDGVRDAVEYVQDELGLDISDSDILTRLGRDESTIRSVFLECRQWRDKTAGETYTSAALHLNGRRVAIFGLQYGGLENMEDTAALYLEKVELLPPDNLRHLSRRFRELGIDYYYATEWRIRRETWLHGESLTAEELREELTAATFRRVAV